MKKYMLSRIKAHTEDLQIYDLDNNALHENYAPMQDALDKMEVNLERVSNVVKNMSIVQSDFYANKQSSDINQCIYAAHSTFLRKYPLSPQVSFSLAEIPLVFVDTSKIHQVLINLLTNAATAIESKKVQCSVKSFEQNAVLNPEIIISSQLQAGVINVSVADNGCGIDKHLLKEIFNPCYTTSKPLEGTGLGLAISRDIANEHAGSLTVTSIKGKGSVFTLSIPMSGIIIH